MCHKQTQEQFQPVEKFHQDGICSTQHNTCYRTVRDSLGIALTVVDLEVMDS